MTVETISGVPGTQKKDFTITSATAEAGAISTIIGAGEIGIIIESTVDLRSINIDVEVQRLTDAFRERVLKLL